MRLSTPKRSLLVFLLLPTITMFLGRFVTATALSILRTTPKTLFGGGKRYVNNASVIFVLGGPGSGKGTQCKLLEKEFGMKHLSVGDLLRDEQRKQTPNGRLIDATLKEGKIVPVAVSVGLIRTAIERMPFDRYLIDGFPRNFDNLKGWREKMLDVCDVDMVLFLECQSEDMQKRLLQRGKTSGRDDDNIESIKKRFKTYSDSTMPLLEYMKTVGGVNVITVNASQSVENVYSDIKVALLHLMKKDLLSMNEKLVRALHTEDIEAYKSTSSGGTDENSSSSDSSSKHSRADSFAGDNFNSEVDQYRARHIKSEGAAGSTTGDELQQQRISSGDSSLLPTRNSDDSRVYYKIVSEDSAAPVVEMQDTQASVTMMLEEEYSKESNKAAAGFVDDSGDHIGTGTSSSTTSSSSQRSCSRGTGKRWKVVLRWRLMNGKWTHVKGLSSAVSVDK